MVVDLFLLVVMELPESILFAPLCVSPCLVGQPPVMRTMEGLWAGFPVVVRQWLWWNGNVGRKVVFLSAIPLVCVHP